jgi:hypothetical protein
MVRRIIQSTYLNFFNGLLYELPGACAILAVSLAVWLEELRCFVAVWGNKKICTNVNQTAVRLACEKL